MRRVGLHLGWFGAAFFVATAGLVSARPTGAPAQERDWPGVDAAPARARLPERPPADRWEAEGGQDPGRPTAGRRAELEARLSRIEARAAARRAAASPACAADGRRLAAAIDAVVARAARRWQLGVEIRELGSGRVVFGLAADRAGAPASTLKLLTALAALELLGPDHQFETSVFRDGDRLVVVGGGDPGLLGPDLHGLAARALAAGATERVEAIVVPPPDRAVVRERFATPSYRARAASLAVDFGTVELSRLGGRLSVRGLETVDGLDDAGGLLAVRGDADHVDPIAELAGAGRGRVAVFDPALVAGVRFAESIRSIAGAPRPPRVERGRPGPGARLVAVHRSAPLATIVGSALRYSNNFTAEQLVWALAAAVAEPGAPPRYEDGLELIARYGRAIAGPDGELELYDGSGLSPANRITPALLDALLVELHDDGSSGVALLTNLPRPGGPGTLRARVGRGGGRVRAKTGTLGRHSGLAGLVTTSDGRRGYAFTILVHGADAAESRPLQDAIVRVLLAELDRAGAAGPRPDPAIDPAAPSRPADRACGARRRAPAQRRGDGRADPRD